MTIWHAQDAVSAVAADTEAVATHTPEFDRPPFSDEAAASFRAVVNLFARWQVTDEQASSLLDIPVRTYRRWKKGDVGRLGRDARARLGNLLGIHKSLRIIFREPQRGYAWVKRDNDAFGGRTALDVMLGGDLVDLMRVRAYLDAERGLG